MFEDHFHEACFAQSLTEERNRGGIRDAVHDTKPNEFQVNDRRSLTWNSSSESLEVEELLEYQHLEENEWIYPLSSGCTFAVALIGLIQSWQEGTPRDHLGQDLEDGLFVMQLANSRLLVPKTSLAHLSIFSSLIISEKFLRGG